MTEHMSRSPSGATPFDRRVIADEIDRLLAMLDEFDGDENLEDGGDDEHSLGGGAHGGNTDREYDPADDEPALGWTAGTNQDCRKWLGRPPMTGDMSSSWEDEEAEHDGREPDADLEPDADDGHDQPEGNPAYAASLRARRSGAKLSIVAGR